MSKIVKNLFILTLSLLLFFPSFLWGAILPYPEVVNSQKYDQEELYRLYKFYKIRPATVDLCQRIADKLEGMDAIELAIEWHKHTLELPLKPEIRSKINKKIEELSNYSPEMKQNLPLTEKDKLIASATILEDSNSPDQSAINYLQAYELSKEPQLLVAAIERFSWASKPSSALKAYEKLLRTKGYKTTTTDLQKMGELAEWATNYPKALYYYKRVFKRSPSLANGEKVVQAHLALNENAEAASLMEKLILKYPRSKGLRAQLVDIYSWQGKTDKATALLEQLPGRYLTLERLFMRASEYLKTSQNEKCLKDCDSIILKKRRKTAPENAIKAAIIAISSIQQTKTSTNASKYKDVIVRNFKYLRKTGSLEPFELVTVFRVLAENAEAKNDLNQAASYREKLLFVEDSDQESLLKLAEIYTKQNNLSSAIKAYEKLLKITPEDPYLKNDLSQLYIKTGQAWKSVQILEGAYQAGESPELHRQELLNAYKANNNKRKIASFLQENQQDFQVERRELINAYLEAGENWEAAQLILKELEQNPFDDDLAKTLKELSPYYPQQYKTFKKHEQQWIENIYNKQIASITLALEKNPVNVSLLKERAAVYTYLNKPDRAMQDYKLIFKISKGEVDSLKKAIETGEWAGKSPEVKELRKSLNRIEPENASNTQALAQLYASDQDFSKSYELFKSLENNSSLDPVILNTSAFQSYEWSGRSHSTKKLIDELRNKVQNHKDNFAKKIL